MSPTTSGSEMKMELSEICILLCSRRCITLYRAPRLELCSGRCAFALALRHTVLGIIAISQSTRLDWKSMRVKSMLSLDDASLHALQIHAAIIALPPSTKCILHLTLFARGVPSSTVLPFAFISPSAASVRLRLMATAT